jgi:hypothetical protein
MSRPEQQDMVDAVSSIAAWSQAADRTQNRMTDRSKAEVLTHQRRVMMLEVHSMPVRVIREMAEMWRIEDELSSRDSVCRRSLHDCIDILIDEIARLRDTEVVVRVR